ncbi:MAG TPA: prepilin-type N-terminal cleavage/methylation domain-containing protein [Acidimicrobiales bacterium]|nr:prepilin-type N-terminal cleavage/methylation domain-containing protein [Acidimicrobiales bacterium]
MPERRRQGKREPTDQGFTLVEMMMAMLLLTVVLSLVMESLVSLQRSVVTADARTQAVDQARLAVEQIDRQVRSGNIFYAPFDSGLELLVFTQANGNQKCVEWQVDTASQSLQSRSWTPTWQTDGSPAVAPWSTIATGVTNTSTDAPFTLATSSSLYGGRILDISLTTNASNSHALDSAITDSVEGRNTVYGYSTDSCSSTDAPAT